MQRRSGAWVVTRYDDAAALLADARYVVPEAGDDGERGTLGWLRRTVCRFSEGAAHARRRALAEAELARMEPAALRTAARDLAARILDAGPADSVAAVARRVPVAVLGEAMGVTGPHDLERLTEAVPVVAAVYLTGTDRPEVREAADEAVAVLVALLGPGPDERVANRIAVLVQACEATAGLIERGVPDAGRREAGAILDETLRFDPPIPQLRRVATDTAVLGGRTVTPGDGVVIDVRAVNRDPAAARPITFGAGRRACPGAEQALALAAGVLDALARVKEQA